MGVLCVLIQITAVIWILGNIYYVPLLPTWYYCTISYTTIALHKGIIKFWPKNSKNSYSACITVPPLSSFVPHILSSPHINKEECQKCLCNWFTLYVSQWSHYVPSANHHLWCYVMSSTGLKSKHYGFHVLRYGACISQLNLAVVDGWMDSRDNLHAFSCLYCCVTAEYKVHWFMGFPLINSQGKFFLLKRYVWIN